MKYSKIIGKKLQVYIIPILNDNYVFIIVNNKSKCLIVDPGDSSEVFKLLEHLSLSPEAILVTHHHLDHIGGVKNLCNHFFSLPVIDNENIQDLSSTLGPEFSFVAHKTPGHTKDHIIFYEQNERWLFSGDVLFRFGCGRIFDGTYEELYGSLQKIKNFSEDTLVFCTHEYTFKNLEFCKNKNLIDTISAENFINSKEGIVPTIPFTLKSELALNPFLKVASGEEFKKLRILRNQT